MRGKNFSVIVAGAVIAGLAFSEAQASSISPSRLYIDDPAMVLLVDGSDKNSSVSINFQLLSHRCEAFDFGFMDDGGYVSLTGRSHTHGQHTFLGGDVVDFALRNYGPDHLFGTLDDLIYRLSDSAGYAQQHYFGAIMPSRSDNPDVTETYYRHLVLKWDLNLDGRFDMRTLIEFKKGKFDGLMPSFTVPGPTPFPGEVPAAVPVPAAFWLFSSGLLGLAATFRRR